MPPKFQLIFMLNTVPFLIDSLSSYMYGYIVIYSLLLKFLQRSLSENRILLTAPTMNRIFVCRIEFY